MATENNATSKPVTPREDPVARAERLLAEAKEKAAARAEKQLAGAQAALELATNSLAKAQRVFDERWARVLKLESDLGLDATTPAEESDDE